MLYRCQTVALFVLLVFCHTALAKDLISAEQLPAWFAESLQDEKNVPLRSYLKIRDLGISKKVIGELEIVPVGDSAWNFVNDIGTESPLDCYVLTEFDGPATSLYNMVDYGLQDAAEFNDKPLTGMRTFSVDHAVLADTAVHSLDTLYNLGEGEEMVTGVLKAKSAQVGDNLLICMHNEIGFRDTFTTVFTSLIDALKTGITREPFFEIIMTLEMNQEQIGFSREAFYIDADGDIEKQGVVSALAPKGPVAVLRSDTVSQSWSYTDGSLINASQYSVGNGAVAYMLFLEMTEEGWHLSGDYQGKEVDRNLKHEDTILSDYGSHLASLAMTEKRMENRTYKMWAVDRNANGLVDVIARNYTGPDNFDYVLDVNGHRAFFHVDDAGIIKSSTIDVSLATMSSKRVLLRGSPVIQKKEVD